MATVEVELRGEVTSEAIVSKDLDLLDITENDSLDRAQWRKQISVADPKWLGLKAQSYLVPFGLEAQSGKVAQKV